MAEQRTDNLALCVSTALLTGNVVALLGTLGQPANDWRNRRPLTVMGGNCSFASRDLTEGQSMSDHRHIVVPRADRYGHPEGEELTALALTSHEHGVAAPHCDRYGHVEGNERRVKCAAESVFVVR